jgi:hypothetical protein
MRFRGPQALDDSHRNMSARKAARKNKTCKIVKRTPQSRREIGTDNLRLATNQVRDSKNTTAQTMRLNSRACPREKPWLPSRIKAKELETTLELYIKIGHPRSSGGLDFSNASSKVSNIFLRQRRHPPTLSGASVVRVAIGLAHAEMLSGPKLPVRVTFGSLLKHPDYTSRQVNERFERLRRIAFHRARLPHTRTT